MAANSLYTQYKTANIAIKLIVINTIVYILFRLIPWIFQINIEGVEKYFRLPSNFMELAMQPWSLLSYAFLHAGVWHLLWNMIYLYIFSRFILNLFSEKRLLTVYLLGGMFGGLFYVIFYNLLPAFKGDSVLIGASAAVNAIIVFIATYTPNTQIRFFIFNFKLWHIALFFVLIDLLSLPDSGNAGGLLSHLGGAAFGYVYALQLAKGNDIGLWWERIMDSVTSFFSGSSTKSKRTGDKRSRSKMRTVHKKQTTTSTSKGRLNKTEQQQKIDAILDKISKSGYDSLSKAEKDFLFKAGKE